MMQMLISRKWKNYWNKIQKSTNYSNKSMKLTLKINKKHTIFNEQNSSIQVYYN
jgi:hypothetical protein